MCSSCALYSLLHVAAHRYHISRDLVSYKTRFLKIKPELKHVEAAYNAVGNSMMVL